MAIQTLPQFQAADCREPVLAQVVAKVHAAQVAADEAAFAAGEVLGAALVDPRKVLCPRELTIYEAAYLTQGT